MYEIFTDTAANLDCSLLEELGVGLIPFSFYYNGEEHLSLIHILMCIRDRYRGGTGNRHHLPP